MFYNWQQLGGVAVANQARLDLNRIKIFAMVVAHGSFSKAALALRQPKSRISRHVAALEAELGLQLIHRTTRQFRLTDVGRELFTRSQSPLHELSELVETLQTSSHELSGMLKVTAPEDLGISLIADICRAFTEANPKVRIDLNLSIEYLDLVKESVDVAIRVGVLDSSSLKRRQIGRVRMGLFVSPALLDRHATVRTLPDLVHLPFLNFSRVPMRRDKIILTDGRVECPLTVQAIFSSNNLLALRKMAVQGLGLALLPQFLVLEDLQQGNLRPLFPEWSSREMPIQALTPAHRLPQPRVKQFLEFTVQQLTPYFS